MKNINIKGISKKTLYSKQSPKEVDEEYIRTVKMGLSTKREEIFERQPRVSKINFPQFLKATHKEDLFLCKCSQAPGRPLSKHLSLGSGNLDLTCRQEEEQWLRGMCSVTTLPGPSWFCHSLALSPWIRNLTSPCLTQVIKVPSYGVVVKTKISSVKCLDGTWHETNTMICWLKLNSHLEVLPKSRMQLNFIFPTLFFLRKIRCL